MPVHVHVHMATRERLDLPRVRLSLLRVERTQGLHLLLVHELERLRLRPQRL